MKLLLHACCAPCSIYCIEHLKKSNIIPTVYWYNPNIHPYIEYQKRKEALEEYTDMMGIKSIFDYEYGLRDFTKNVINALNTRCLDYCYRKRLEQTAKYAKENNYTAFSTTLLISPYQKHDELKKLGEKTAKKCNIQFMYEDFRAGFRQSQEKAKDLRLYNQKYCGCVFSEEERYLKK